MGVKVEVRCGEAFTRDPSTGSSLQTYRMDIKANIAMWEEERWNLQTVFHYMHATFQVLASWFYLEAMEGVLDMPETNSQGKDVLDEMRYLIPIRESVHCTTR